MSNPFRKKALEAVDAARVQSPVKSSLRSDSPFGGDGAPLGKPRTVKKVRVLSPPPLSPEPPEWPETVNRNGYQESLYRDPFGVSGSADESDTHTISTALPPPPLPSQASAVPAENATPPANPFSKTLQAPEESRDMENQRKSEGAALKAGNLGRHSLNVDSFKRLLLTGKINDPESILASESPAMDPSADPLVAEETTTERDQEEEASSTSETSSVDNSDRNTGPVSAASPDGHTGRDRKAPPPPPSSRHGKSLRDDSLKLGLPTDFNKPLPPSPVRTSTDDGADSPFDRESAGKVPDQVPELEPGAGAVEPQRDAVTQPSGSKKSAPAPPPRRGHARGESKGHLSTADPSRRRGDELPVGAGSDETPARSGEPRHTGHAPTPPPRRPHGVTRQITPTSSHVTSIPPSPTPQPNLYHSAPLDTTAAAAHHEAHPAGSKLASAPPRPPTRNPSVKRTASVASVDGLRRRASMDSKARDGPARPSPPPPRQQGSGSGGLHALPRQTSDETASAAPEPGNGHDILADLDALQREVDALRGQIR